MDSPKLVAKKLLAGRFRFFIIKEPCVYLLRQDDSISANRNTRFLSYKNGIVFKKCG